MPAENRSLPSPSDNEPSPGRRAGGAPRRSRLLRAARFYLERGLVLTPTRAATTKGAYLPGWRTRRLTLAQLDVELDRPGKGIGVVLGDPSGGLVDVDLDHPAAVAVADALLPPTGLVSGRTARPRTHRFYRAAGAETAVYKARATGMLVELRATGCQTALPPSPHPAGRYHWDALGEPAPVEAEVLGRLAGQVASAALLIAQGWSVERAVALVGAADPERAAAWRRVQPRDASSIRRWLSLGPRPAGGTQAARRAFCGAAASSYTQTVVAGVGGVVGAAHLLGLQLREGRQRCPWHDGRGARSLQVTGPLWRCHAGCGSGNPIHLAMKVLALDYRGARDALAGRLGIASQDHAPPPRGGGGKRSRGTPVALDHDRDEARGRRRAEQRRG